MNSKSKDRLSINNFINLNDNDFVDYIIKMMKIKEDFIDQYNSELPIIFNRCLKIIENKIQSNHSDVNFSLLMCINEILKRCDKVNTINVSPIYKIIFAINNDKCQDYQDTKLELECTQFLQIIFNKNSTDFISFFEKNNGLEMIDLFLKSDNKKVQINSWSLVKRMLNMKRLKCVINNKYFLEMIIDLISHNSCLQAKINVSSTFLKVLDSNNGDQIRFLKKDLNSIQILLNQIHFEHQDIIKLSRYFADKCSLITKYLWCLLQLTVDNNDYQYVRDIGGIPIILALFHAPSDILLNINSHNEHQHTDVAEKYSQMIGTASTVISILCRNESNNLEVAQKSGIYLLSHLLIILPNLNNLNLTYLQKTIFRALRFLFSLERNRKRFKNIFPATLYEAFVDIGHFSSDMGSYDGVVSIFKNLTETDKRIMKESIECLNQREKTRCIRDYTIMELLGSGAFGSVYKAKRNKSSHDSYCAIKEVNLAECQLGSTSQERSDSIRQIVCELDIIKNQLRHPNVVRYYRTFHDAPYLYVVMAFIEGISLGEQINCMKEKEELYQESRIWKISIQLMLALRYLHKEKSIIHRDLTPNNIMVGDGDHTTITDFGLAKQRLLESRGRESRSILGTLTYVCPEVIQHQPYCEKADIWSLGCIIYQMCCLTTPFNAESELTLAEKICKGNYVLLKDFQFHLPKYNTNDYYELGDIVDHCLITNPEIRFNVLDLARLISDKIFMYLDQSHQKKIEIEISFIKERQQRKCLENQIKEINNDRAFRMDSLIVDNSSSDFSPAVRSENDQESDDISYDVQQVIKQPSEFNSFQRSISSEFSSLRSSYTSDNQSPCNNSLNNQYLTSKFCSFNSIDSSNSPVRNEISKRRIQSRQLLKNDSSVRLRHCSSSSLMSISQKSLRHISEDPITKLLTWLHKLYFLCHTEFISSQCESYSEQELIQSKRYLKNIFNFVFKLPPNQMKKEISSLQSGADGSVLPNISTNNLGQRFANITSEELYYHMEDLLLKLDYYR